MRTPCRSRHGTAHSCGRVLHAHISERIETLVEAMTTPKRLGHERLPRPCWEGEINHEGLSDSHSSCAQVCGPMGCKMIDGPPEAPEYETQVCLCVCVCVFVCMSGQVVCAMPACASGGLSLPCCTWCYVRCGVLHTHGAPHHPPTHAVLCTPTLAGNSRTIRFVL